MLLSLSLSLSLSFSCLYSPSCLASILLAVGLHSGVWGWLLCDVSMWVWVCLPYPPWAGRERRTGTGKLELKDRQADSQPSGCSRKGDSPPLGPVWCQRHVWLKKSLCQPGRGSECLQLMGKYGLQKGDGAPGGEADRWQTGAEARC
jgi:hypothetical protein